MLDSVQDWTLLPIMTGVMPAVNAGETPVMISIRFVPTPFFQDIDLKPLMETFNIKSIQTIFADLYLLAGFRTHIIDVDTGNRILLRGGKTIYQSFNLSQSGKVRLESRNSAGNPAPTTFGYRIGFLNVPLPNISWDN